MVAAFKSEIGPAQQQGGIFPGIVILQVMNIIIIVIVKFDLLKLITLL